MGNPVCIDQTGSMISQGMTELTAVNNHRAFPRLPGTIENQVYNSTKASILLLSMGLPFSPLYSTIALDIFILHIFNRSGAGEFPLHPLMQLEFVKTGDIIPYGCDEIAGIRLSGITLTAEINPTKRLPFVISSLLCTQCHGSTGKVLQSEISFSCILLCRIIMCFCHVTFIQHNTIYFHQY